MTRRLTFLLVANLILSFGALGWVAWISLEPAHWFDDVYAVSEQAQESADELEVALAEIESRLGEIETTVGDTETAGSELEERVGEVEATLSGVCSTLSLELDFFAAC